MKKAELIKKISERTGLLKVECESVINTFSDIVQEQLSNGEDVTIKGFVSFEVRSRKSRKGFNPITGKHEVFKSVKTVNCKAGKPLKDAVKEN